MTTICCCISSGCNITSGCDIASDGKLLISVTGTVTLTVYLAMTGTVTVTVYLTMICYAPRTCPVFISKKKWSKVFISI